MFDKWRNTCSLPISSGMHPADAYDDRGEFGNDLPELPIPRPGEAADRAPAPTPIAPPSLGGGASFTSVDTDELEAATAAEAEAADVRFTWELAARLTAGMLSNPVRANSSVKDAMGVFDQFLQEMHAYVRLTADFGPGPAQRRSADREAYFHAARDAGDARTAGPAPASAAHVPTTPAPVPAARPAPTLPRPASSYQPIPPGTRYMPGGMAGPVQRDPSGDRDEDVA
jgi:hypothetical protein